MVFLLQLFFLALSIAGAAVLGFYLILGPSRYDGPEAGSGKGVTAQILVLGDVGRSPRMTYHALSIANHGGKVDLIGYLESSPHPDVVQNPRISIVPLPTPAKRPGFLPFILYAPIKVVLQVGQLLWVLCYATKPAQWLLVQNPPTIPTLAIAALVCRLRGTKLIIDWHNYGWTILAGTRGAKHPLVGVSKLFEVYFGRLGHTNLTVTHAMARQLRAEPYSIQGPIVPVHDRPAAIFQPITSPSLREKALMKTIQRKELIPAVLSGSMKLVVSSTSWTPDEDFGYLLEALVKYESQKQGPPLLVVITGKGPQKQMYLDSIAKLQRQGILPSVIVETAFLPFADYAALLAAADLGVCLHNSSSGVDLPMKVVDMFGAGLPVAAYSAYESFGELVKDGENGYGFETSEELAELFLRLFSDAGARELGQLRRGATQEGTRRWDEEWDSTVGPILGFKARSS
ncbi:hypothetical protein GQ53DRAFT_214539 [Thozetella sp. PMI_491]|nr:hypothetical protein GQ53DRAFT_214539 [Thozetella sp. PMI_491]